MQSIRHSNHLIAHLLCRASYLALALASLHLLVLGYWYLILLPVMLSYHICCTFYAFSLYLDIDRILPLLLIPQHLPASPLHRLHYVLCTIGNSNRDLLHIILQQPCITPAISAMSQARDIYATPGRSRVPAIASVLCARDSPRANVTHSVPIMCVFGADTFSGYGCARRWRLTVGWVGLSVSVR